MLSFECLGAGLYELKALRCLETGQGTATDLLKHWQGWEVFSGGKEAVIIIHALPDVRRLYESCNFSFVCQLNADKKLVEVMREKKLGKEMIDIAVQWKKGVRALNEERGTDPVMMRTWKDVMNSSLPSQ